MKNILIHVTGSIACFKAGTLVSLLTKKGYQVQATASAGGLRFIQPALLEGLTGRPLLTDIFSGGEDAMHHISLSQNGADLIIAKGQGNFETLQGCGLNIYYAFLCKCQFFADRFGVPIYTGMLVRERR